MSLDTVLDSLEFRLIGPFRGGRSVAVAAHPAEPHTYYMGTTGGGVWKSVDGGTYWRNVSDGFFKRASVGALAVAPSDPNVIWAGMGESTIRGNVSHGDGVYRSTDAGKTWSHLGLETTRNIAKLRVDPRDPDVAFVAAFGHAHGPNAERGVYRTTDGGKSWELVLHRSEDAGACDLTIDPFNPRVIYAALWEARRGPHYMSSGGEGSGLFRSTDGGDTWTELTRNQGMPETGLIGKIGVSVSGARRDRVYAIVEHTDGGIHRSDDGGETWVKLSDDRRLRQRAWYYSHITADPGDADSVWVLNVEQFKSIDAGKTFEPVPAPHGDNHDLWIDPTNPDRMILGNDGGATISLNGGRSWTPQYSQPTSELYHVETDARLPYHVYGSQQDNTSISLPSRSNFGAITRTEWSEVGGGEAGYIQVRPDNPNIVYAGEYQGIMTRYDHATRLAKSISVWQDDNSGWGAEDYKHRFQWTYPILLSPHDPNTLYCGGNQVFRTRNEGQSWDTISPDLTRNDPSTLGSSGGPITKDNTGAEVYATVFALAESPLEQGLIWAGSDDGRIHVTTDSGESWTEVTPPTNLLPEWALISIIEPSPHDRDTAYVAATRYKSDDFAPYLLKTTDLGKSWTSIAAGIPADVFTRVVRADPAQRGLLYCGTETGILVSHDDGASWRPLGGNFPVVPVHDLQIRNDDLVVATHGRSFWVLDDLSLIRQATTEDALSATNRLFVPRDTYRWGSMFSFGHEPVPGQNYWFAATQVPSLDVTKKPDGTLDKRFLDAGTNPPDGVIVNYLLGADDQAVKLTILDEAGNEVRSLRSKPPKKEDDETFPPKAEADEDEGETFVPNKRGLNRFVWDFRRAEATKISTKGGDQPGRSGPKVPPGAYRVRVESGDWSEEQLFAVVADPRVPVAQRDRKGQAKLTSDLHAKHDQLNRAVNELRELRDQAIDRARKAQEAGDEGVVADCKSLKDELDAIEGELLQPKIKSSQDSLNYPIKLNSKLVNLMFTVELHDGAPPAQSLALASQLMTGVDEQIARLAQVRRGPARKLGLKPTSRATA